MISFTGLLVTSLVDERFWPSWQGREGGGDICFEKIDLTFQIAIAQNNLAILITKYLN